MGVLGKRAFKTFLLMGTRIRPVLLLLAGVLMLFAAFINVTVLVPHLKEDLIEIEARETLVRAIIYSLHFGWVAMFGFALLTLSAAWKAFRTGAVEKVSMLVIALVYIGYGIATYAVNGSHHLLGYVLIGLLLIGAVLVR